MGSTTWAWAHISSFIMYIAYCILSYGEGRLVIGYRLWDLWFKFPLKDYFHMRSRLGILGITSPCLFLVPGDTVPTTTQPFPNSSGASSDQSAWVSSSTQASSYVLSFPSPAILLSALLGCGDCAKSSILTFQRVSCPTCSARAIAGVLQAILPTSVSHLFLFALGPFIYWFVSQ